MIEKNSLNRFSENDALLQVTQNFYKAIEIAIADNFPGCKSDYQILKISIDNEIFPVWQVIEKKLSSFIASWPEWWEVLNSESSELMPQKFEYFDVKILETIGAIQEFLKKIMGESIAFSIKRFEEHTPYQKACCEFKSCLSIDKLEKIPEALPFFDIWSPTRLSESIVADVLSKIEEELKSIENISFPYNRKKNCHWNLSLVIRIQIQILRTLREKIFGIIAVAETYFQEFFTEEVLKEELLPLIRSSLSNYKFISSVYTG